MALEPLEPFSPDWPAPPGVGALVSTRRGGVSTGAHASLNLGTRCGDDPAAVAENRRRLGGGLPASPVWLQQVHGTRVVDADAASDDAAEPRADAAVARAAGTVCAVLIADCLPVLFADDAGSVVAAAHAGWRGLCAGVLEATVRALRVPPARVLAWLGPAIGPRAYEVGDEVRATFIARDSGTAAAFAPGRPGHWQLDLYAAARRRLGGCGVRRIYGGGRCTFAEAEHFFSYRRDGVTGRMAALIWRS